MSGMKAILASACGLAALVSTQSPAQACPGGGYRPSYYQSYAPRASWGCYRAPYSPRIIVILDNDDDSDPRVAQPRDPRIDPRSPLRRRSGPRVPVEKEPVVRKKPVEQPVDPEEPSEPEDEVDEEADSNVKPDLSDADLTDDTPAVTAKPRASNPIAKQRQNQIFKFRVPLSR